MTAQIKISTGLQEYQHKIPSSKTKRQTKEECSLMLTHLQSIMICAFCISKMPVYFGISLSMQAYS